MTTSFDILVPWNDESWIAAHRHAPDSGRSWARSPRRCLSDWNLCVDDAIDGHIIQGCMVTRDLPRLPSRATITFHSRPRLSRAALYETVRSHDAELLVGERAAQAWQDLLSEDRFSRRADELRARLSRWPDWAEQMVDALQRGPSLAVRVALSNLEDLGCTPVDPGHWGVPYITAKALETAEPSWFTPPGDAQTPRWHEGELGQHTRIERRRLRSRIERVKRTRAVDGRLRCEACGFDFTEVYATEEAIDCIEGHHTKPLHTFRAEGEPVSDDDIALLCPNCHRVAHRTGIYTLEELTALLDKHRTP